jgi:hypothetical protein
MAERSPGETRYGKKQTAGEKSPRRRSGRRREQKRSGESLTWWRNVVEEGNRCAGGGIDLVETVADAAKRNELGHNGGPLSHRLAARGILYVNYWGKSMKGYRYKKEG